MKRSALALRAEKQSTDPKAASFIMPTDEQLTQDKKAFRDNLERYYLANKVWETKSERNSRIFKIVGTGVALAGGILGLALNNDIAGYTSLAAAANTGVMAVFNVERDLPSSGICVTYIEGQIRLWDAKSIPKDATEYGAYRNEKVAIVDSLGKKKCKGF